jgi:hypothetical protein
VNDGEHLATAVDAAVRLGAPMPLGAVCLVERDSGGSLRRGETVTVIDSVSLSGSGARSVCVAKGEWHDVRCWFEFLRHTGVIGYTCPISNLSVVKVPVGQTGAS